MNCLIWNCRGAGGKEFSSLFRDTSRIYHLDFVAIVEPRISGQTADKVIRKIGFANVAKVDAQGFSGGIWCLWKSSCPPIYVHSISRYCAHLIVNPNSLHSWSSQLFMLVHVVIRDLKFGMSYWTSNPLYLLLGV